jgi:uncharacterized protein (TIGR03067 family)
LSHLFERGIAVTCTVPILISLIICEGDNKAPLEPALTELEGRWEMLSTEKPGIGKRKVDPRGPKEYWIFEGDRFTWDSGQFWPKISGYFRVGQANEHGHLDLWFDLPIKFDRTTECAIKAIYKIENDQLTICKGGITRPTRFSTEEGRIYTLARVKKK